MKIGDLLYVQHTGTGFYASSQPKGSVEHDRTDRQGWETFRVEHISDAGTLIVSCPAHTHGARYSVWTPSITQEGGEWRPFVLPE